MAKTPQRRSSTRKAKLARKTLRTPFALVVRQTERLWRRFHLTYDQAIQVAKHVRARLSLERPAKRPIVVDRLSHEEERKLIAHAYRAAVPRGLLVKTLLLSGARVSEFVALRVEDFFFEECMLRIRKAKGGKERVVPILPELAQELRTHLVGREAGSLFETRTATSLSPRRVQQIIKEVAAGAGIAKRVYPHLLRHTVAQHLLEGGMPLDQVQKFLGHAKIETAQIYATSSPAMIQESYRRALGGR
jgi:integrase/recombinase XerD